MDEDVYKLTYTERCMPPSRMARFSNPANTKLTRWIQCRFNPRREGHWDSKMADTMLMKGTKKRARKLNTAPSRTHGRRPQQRCHVRSLK